METRFRTPLMSAQEEYAGARAIEAGVLAEHLLATGERPVPATTAELRAIAEAGVRARRHFLLANLRLVRRLAGVEARRCGLPVDDLLALGTHEPDLALGEGNADAGQTPLGSGVILRRVQLPGQSGRDDLGLSVEVQEAGARHQRHR